MIKIVSGNIFNTECDYIVNTVNCMGVMGAGIAYEFKLRYPEMYKKYKKICEDNLFDIGMLWIYKDPDKKILCFPTKKHLKYPSKIEYLELGLQKFVSIYKEKGIKSIAFPILGASLGGINIKDSLCIMEKHLSLCDIYIEIWMYDPKSIDDVFINYKKNLLSKEDSYLSEKTGIKINIIKKIKTALMSNDIYSLSGLLSIDGIGEKTLEKSYSFAKKKPDQYDLF